MKRRANSQKYDEPAAEWVPVRDLVRWVKNPRINEAAIAVVIASIRQFGWGAPLVARKANREIIAGDTRIQAAVRLGIERVPVRYMNLSASEAHAYAVADNKIGEIAKWNNERLREVFVELKEDRFFDDRTGAAESIGFRDDEIVSFTADGEERETGDRDDEIPQTPKVAVTRAGDVWTLGRHRLLCGDCRVYDDVLRLAAGAKVNVAFTSPPYASQRKYDESSGFKPIRPDAFVEWFKDVQANVARVLAGDGSWFVNIKEHCDDGQRSLYVKDLTIAHVRMWSWLFIDEFSWNRPAPPGLWPSRFKNGFEPVFHFSRTRACKFRPHAVALPSDNIPVKSSLVGANVAGPNGEHWNLSSETQSGLALPSNVVRASGVEDGTGHSAAFPVALPAFFIKAFSDTRDVVFDPFMGSGTTLIASEKTGRAALGTEISPSYCDVVVERWQNFTGQKATRERARR